MEDGQIERLCQKIEEKAREHVLSEVPKKAVEELVISVETRGTKPLIITIDVSVSLSPEMKGHDVERLAREATEAAFSSGESFLREMACHIRE